MNRRRFLGGAAWALALPALPSLAGPRASAPRRVVYWFLPNGLDAATFTPAEAGPGWVATPILEPTGPIRDRLTVLTGLENRADPSATHESCLASLLTDHTIADLAAAAGNAVTADQYAARAIGGHTPFPSLQLGTGEAHVEGRGATDVYATHLSWSDADTPLPALSDPKMLFDRLFAGSDATATAAEAERRAALRKSVLDAALERVATIEGRLDAADRAKLDQFTTSVREVERRIDALQALACEVPDEPVPNLPLAERIAVTGDLLVLALRCDYTRVATFMIGPTQALTAYPELGLAKPHHSISHDFVARPEDHEAYTAIQRLNVERWTTFARQLADTPDGEGDLLSSTLLALVTEFSDAATHTAHRLPMLLAGGEAGGVAHGSHRALAVPHADALRALIAYQGVSPEGFGEHATGTLDLG